MSNSDSSLSPAPAGTFSIAALPDTQKYMATPDATRGSAAAGRDCVRVESRASGPEVFEAMVRWIVDHREAQRIVCVSHLGDVVLNNTPAEWAIADRVMGLLDGVLPYGISVGNKDMDCATGDASLFSSVFPAARFTGHSWYGGAARDNADSFQLFEAQGLGFLILHLECNAPDTVLDWANRVLADHADRVAIISAHMFLGPVHEPRTREESFTNRKGVMDWSKCHGPAGNAPAALWKKCFGRHAHVRLVLCGDQSHTQAMHVALTGERGNIVYVCLSDYGGAPEGWLRLYRFAPADGQIRVFTVGAASGALCRGTSLVPDCGAHQFTLPWPGG